MSQPATPDQIAKLPKWARGRLTELQNEVHALRRALNADNEPTRVSFRVNVPHDDIRYLPENRDIDFVVFPGRRRGNEISVRLDAAGGCLIVRGDTGVRLVPRAANAVDIYLED